MQSNFGALLPQLDPRWISICDAPRAPGAQAMPASWLLREAGKPGSDGWGGSPGDQLHGASSVVDSTISLSSATKGSVPCVLATASLYMSDVYLSGCDTAVIPSGRAALPAAAGTEFTHIPLLSMGTKGYNQTSPYTFELPTVRFCPFC